MNSRNDLRNSIREDERRRQDEARSSSLQSQIDELRSLVREVVSRQTRSDEHAKSYEIGLAELRTLVENHHHEATQSAQARQMDDARVREQITALDSRIDESQRPIRALQSHVSEILESMRRERDDDQDVLRRFQELETIIDDVAAHADRNAEAFRTLRDALETVRTNHAQTQRDLIKTDDAVHIVEQESRRRLAELAREIERIDERLGDIRPRFEQLEAMIDDTRRSIEHIDPALEDLRGIGKQMQDDIERAYLAHVERDEIQSERIDETRVQMDTNIRDVRQSIEAYYERVTQRIDELGDRNRELSYRFNVIDMRLDELVDADLRLRREVWHLHEMRTRRRLEQIQGELEQVVDQRRSIESELLPERSSGDQETDKGDEGR